MTAEKSTSVRSFLDTNVLVYTDDGDAPEKQRLALDLLAHTRREGNGVVSTQVLQEYFAASTRKLGVPAPVARRKVELFSRHSIIRVDVPEILAATDLHIIHSVSFWDGLVIASAKRAGCRVLYSEEAVRHSRRNRGSAVDRQRPIGPRPSPLARAVRPRPVEEAQGRRDGAPSQWFDLSRRDTLV